MNTYLSAVDENLTHYHDIPLLPDGLLKQMDSSGLFQWTESYFSDKASPHYAECISYCTNLECCLSGRISELPFHPVSNDARRNLLCITDFFLMDMEEAYFTRRKDLEQFEFRYTLAGTGYLEYEGKNYLLHPGEGYLIDNRRPHYYKTYGSRWLSTVLHFNGIYARDIYPHFLENDLVVFHKTDNFDPDILQYDILKCCSQILPFWEFQVSAKLTGLLTALLVETDRQKNLTDEKASALVQDAVDYLKSHYHENVRIQELSDRLFVSREHLSREFKKHLSLSPREYLVKFRLYKSKGLLRMTSLSMAEISLKTGFPNESSFFHDFREDEGMTPKQYRKQFQNKK